LQNKAESKEIPVLPEDTTADNLSETDYLLCYYRLDEGPGTRELIEASDKRIEAVIVSSDTAYEKVWGECLMPGNPLEYEDRWGTKIEPNRCLNVDNENFIKISSSDKLSIMKGTFTIELWVKVESLDNENIILQSANDSLALILKESNLLIRDKGNEIEVKCEKSVSKRRWVHIAIIWHCNAETPIQFLINGKMVGSSKEKIKGTKWVEEDIIVGKFKGAITEVRIWSTNLNEKIISENRKFPLSILANRQSQLKVSINKQVKNVEVEKKKGTIGAPKKAVLSLPKSANKRGAPKKPPSTEPPNDKPVIERSEKKVTNLWKEEIIEDINPNIKSLPPRKKEADSVMSSVTENVESVFEGKKSSKDNDLFKMDMNNFDGFSEPSLSSNDGITKSFNDLPQSTATSQMIKDSVVSMLVLKEEVPFAKSVKTSSTLKDQTSLSKFSTSDKSSMLAKNNQVNSGSFSSYKDNFIKSEVKSTIKSTPESINPKIEEIKLMPMKEHSSVKKEPEEDLSSFKDSTLKAATPKESIAKGKLPEVLREELTPASKGSVLSRDEAKVMLPNESLAKPTESLALKSNESPLKKPLKRKEVLESDLTESVEVAKGKSILSPNKELTKAKDKDITNNLTKESSSIEATKNKVEEDKNQQKPAKTHKRTEVKESSPWNKTQTKAEANQKQATPTKASDSPIRTASITSVIAVIASGNIKEADIGIENQLKSFASKSSLDINDKKVITILSRYKFVIKVLELINQLHNSKDNDDLVRAADLANMLTRVKVSNKVKPELYNIAVLSFIEIIVGEEYGNKELCKCFKMC
jgi:hypothetical protein